MKILLLTTHLDIGGISTYVVNLARKLKQNKLEVLVATSGGVLTARLQKENIPWVQIPIRTKNEVHPKVFFSILKLAEIIKREHVDLIHAHTRVTQVASAILRRLTGVPYVTTCHGIYRRRIFRRLFPCWGARVTAISEPVRESLVNDFKVAKNQALLLPNGIDCSEFDALPQTDREAFRQFYGLNGNGLVVGSIARMEKVKGLQNLIRSVPYVIRKHPDTKFFLVGDGKYKSELLKLVDEMKLGEHVITSEATDNVLMPLGLMDIFVHPPIYEEGFGLCILEGMSAGKPVVATNVGGIYMMVKDGENGFLVPPHDPATLADRINFLIENPKMRSEMGLRGRDFARSHFSLDTLTQNLIEVYREVIDLVEKKNGR